MEIKIIYDNTSSRDDLTADWGFACLVEAYGRKILFDTGARGDILLSNMEKMGIKPADIEMVFISHSHWDHTGGLDDFIKAQPVTLYVPASYKPEIPDIEIIPVSESLKIDENIYSTGELMGIEQSLVINTDRGTVVIAGCAHSDVKNILDAASLVGSPRALIGGLHGFAQYNLLASLEMVCPTHCTQHIADIKAAHPDNYIEGGAGRILSF